MGVGADVWSLKSSWSFHNNTLNCCECTDLSSAPNASRVLKPGFAIWHSSLKILPKEHFSRNCLLPVYFSWNHPVSLTGYNLQLNTFPPEALAAAVSFHSQQWSGALCLYRQQGHIARSRTAGLSSNLRILPLRDRMIGLLSKLQRVKGFTCNSAVQYIQEHGLFPMTVLWSTVDWERTNND